MLWSPNRVNIKIFYVKSKCHIKFLIIVSVKKFFFFWYISFLSAYLSIFWAYRVTSWFNSKLKFWNITFWKCKNIIILFVVSVSDMVYSKILYGILTYHWSLNISKSVRSWFQCMIRARSMYIVNHSSIRCVISWMSICFRHWIMY